MNLAFCGCAVSDSSMSTIGLHESNLQYLSVRGCIRVTGSGIEAILQGCGFDQRLSNGIRCLDISQCKNALSWIENGGIEHRGRDVQFVLLKSM